MKKELTTVFFKDKSAEFGYRKAIVMLGDVDYFKKLGAVDTPGDLAKKRERRTKVD